MEQVLLRVESLVSDQNHRLAALEHAVCLMVLGYPLGSAGAQEPAQSSSRARDRDGGGGAKGKGGSKNGSRETGADGDTQDADWAKRVVRSAVEDATTQLVSHAHLPGALSNTLASMASRSGIQIPEQMIRRGGTGNTHVNPMALDQLIQKQAVMEQHGGMGGAGGHAAMAAQAGRAGYEAMRGALSQQMQGAHSGAAPNFLGGLVG